MYLVPNQIQAIKPKNTAGSITHFMPLFISASANKLSSGKNKIKPNQRERLE